MIALIVFGALVLWFSGRAMGATLQARMILLAALYGVATALSALLPMGHPVRDSLGGGPAGWLVFGGAVALVWGYRAGLQRLRSRAQPETPPEAPKRPGAMTETELTRYARHIVLREIGGAGQKKLKTARILVVGAGGLGAPALQYLAAAGVGTIGVIDADTVDLSNLQRQIIHTDDRLGMAKVQSAMEALKSLNPHVEVRPYERRFTADIADALLADYDLVLDGTDNFETRYLVNQAAAKRGIPLVSGALSQWEGQISVFDPANGGPCYQCIFPQAPAADLAPSCAEVGVLSPLPGVIGAMMAAEAVKIVTGAGQPLRGEMLIYDALWGETRKISVRPRADCPVCGDAGTARQPSE